MYQREAGEGLPGHLRTERAEDSAGPTCARETLRCRASSGSPPECGV